MKYKRYENATPLSKEQKVALLKEYIEHYRQLSGSDIGALNRKLPRETLTSFLEEVGVMLQQYAQELAARPGPVQEFLEQNPLPDTMSNSLPKEFRIFCLVLNALKQWVSAEQQATDRYLMGGRARATCRLAANECMITGKSFDGQELNLHHPLRDGRPPIPIIKKGHDIIEGQVQTAKPNKKKVLRN